MIQNKNGAADLTISKLIKWMLVFFVVVLLVMGLISFGLIDKIKLIFPEFFSSENPEDDEFSYSLSCPVKVAFVNGEDYLELCADKDCIQTQKTKLFLEEGSVMVDQKINDEIGKVIRGYVVIFDGVRNGKGTADNPILFYDVKYDIPSYESLLNLHMSYLYTEKILCRESKVSEAEVRKEQATKNITLDGKSFYYNINDLMQNKNSKPTELYLNKELTEKANGQISISADSVTWVSDAGETPEIKTIKIELIPKSPEDLSNYFTHDFTISGETPLKNRLSNEFNQLGVDSGKDDFEYVNYQKKDGKLYVRFYDYDGRNFQTPWILMDYWNTYQTFARAPDWSILK